MSKTAYFITGCHRAINLRDAGQRTRLCETSALDAIILFATANQICRKCPKATINQHIVAHHGDEKQIAPKEQETGAMDWIEEMAALDAAETPQEALKAPEPTNLAPPAEAAPQTAEALDTDVFPVDMEAKKNWGTPLPSQRSEEEPPVDQLLQSIEIRGGPSILGWSKLSTALRCLRLFFYKYVQGWGAPIQVIRPGKGEDEAPTVHPLPLGSTLHAIAELYYKKFYDASVDKAVLNVIKPHYPLLASEAARLWNRYVSSFMAEDVNSWDVRLVEAESRLYFPARNVAGKKRSLCISSRHDTVVRKTQNGQRLPPGERSDTLLHLHDLKTLGQMTEASKETWAHEGQSLQGMATWNMGHGVVEAGDQVTLTPKSLAETYGEAWGFTVTQIGKARGRVGDGKSYTRRLTYPVPKNLIEAFARDMETFLYDELAQRLFHTRCMCEETWRKSYACRDPMTNKVCMFAPICESAGMMDPAALFERNAIVVVTGPMLEAPKKTRGRRKKAKTEGADK